MKPVLHSSTNSIGAAAIASLVRRMRTVAETAFAERYPTMAERPKPTVALISASIAWNCMPLRTWLTYGNIMCPTGSMTAATSATHSSLIISDRSIMAFPPAPPRVFSYLVTACPVWAIASSLERRIDGNPVAVGQPIGFVGHAGDRHHLAEHGLAHACLAGGRAVAGDAIGAAIGGADRQIDHLLGERVERARRHDLFDAFPGALERHWVARQVFPEIVHVRHVSGFLDVVIDRAHGGWGVGVFDGVHDRPLRNPTCRVRRRCQLWRRLRRCRRPARRRRQRRQPANPPPPP